MLTLVASADGWIDRAVDAGGYPALGGLLVAENVFPPIPSEVVLPLAGYYVSQGRMDFLVALLVATVGSIVGALILYAVGRGGGRLLSGDKRLARATTWFDRRGDWVVLLGRLVPGVRSIVSLPAGAARMPLGRFVLLTAIGSAAWNALLIGIGVALGSHWDRVEGVVGPLGKIVVVALVLAAAGWWLLRRRRAVA